jgi:hypothetical protein
MAQQLWRDAYTAFAPQRDGGWMVAGWWLAKGAHEMARTQRPESRRARQQREFLAAVLCHTHADRAVDMDASAAIIAGYVRLARAHYLLAGVALP